MNCPLCNGVGKVRNEKFESREKAIVSMRLKGLTIRQIAKVLGIKSTNTIAYYLNKNIIKDREGEANGKE